MNRQVILQAAAIIRLLDDLKALRATINGGKHSLRVYALSQRDTIEDAITVGNEIAKKVLSDIVDRLRADLRELGVISD